MVPFRLRVATRAAVAALSLLIVVASGVAWAQFRSFSASIPHGAAVPALAPGETDPDGSAQNILLIGNDTRTGATRAELDALHTGHDTSTVNTDTMIVLHIPTRGKPTLVSFPRDSWVTIPGHGKGKINSAYPDAYYAAKTKHASEVQAQSAGIEEMVQVIHNLTGLHIDHYVQVSLIGFYRISEAVGGVTVCLNHREKEHLSGIDLPKGVSTIQGEQALAFVRQRHNLPGGDFDRIKRQQYFLKAAFTKITSAGTLLNPFKIRNLLGAVGSSLLTDPQLNLFDLARQFESLAGGSISTQTIPNNGAKLIYPDGVETSVVQVDTAAMPAFIRSLEGSSDAFKQATAVSARSVTADVLNGTDTSGLAARNASQLLQLGFRTGQVGSTASTPHTVVEYPAGQEPQAKALLAAVPGAKAEQTSVERPTLVLGDDGRQVRGLAVAKSKPGHTGSASAAGAKKKTAPGAGLGCIN